MSDDDLCELVGLRAEANALRAALEELVACKDLKDEESRRRQRRECSRLRPVGNALAEVNATRDDYNRRKPLAWAAARAVLAQVHWPIEPYRPPNQGHPIP